MDGGHHARPGRARADDSGPAFGDVMEESARISADRSRRRHASPSVAGIDEQAALGRRSWHLARPRGRHAEGRAQRGCVTMVTAISVAHAAVRVQSTVGMTRGAESPRRAASSHRRPQAEGALAADAAGLTEVIVPERSPRPRRRPGRGAGATCAHHRRGAVAAALEPFARRRSEESPYCRGCDVLPAPPAAGACGDGRVQRPDLVAGSTWQKDRPGDA